MNAYVERQRFGLGPCLWLSLLLHAVLVLPCLMGPLASEPRPLPAQEAVALFDMLGHQPAVQTPDPPQPRSAPRQQDQAAPPRPQPVRQAPSPVEVPRQADTPRQQEEASPAQQASGEVPRNALQQESVTPEAAAQPTEADLLRRYIAALSRLIKARVFYPAELRSTGHAGTVLVRFTVTESGDILPGSLVVAKGCGHIELDEAALRQVNDIAPFPKPDKAHTVAVPVVFRSEG